MLICLAAQLRVGLQEIPAVSPESELNAWREPIFVAAN